MIITFSVGSKCAVMLPREFINPQMTPAKGLVINKFVDSRSLILVEEVWQFKGFSSSPFSEMCTSLGRIKSENWGWREVPTLVNSGEYIMLPAAPYNLLKPDYSSLESLIKKSVDDFQKLHGFI